MTLEPIRLLFSFHYYKGTDLDIIASQFAAKGYALRVFADSGAFSTPGGRVDVPAYAAWLHRFRHLIDFAAGADVIGDHKLTKVDTDHLLQLNPGPTILPTYHVGEPWEVLDEWASTHSSIALGGLVPWAKNQAFIRTWLRKAFMRIPKGVHVHGFGMTGSAALEFPWGSVDSTSWVSGSRYGGLYLWNPRSSKFESFTTSRRLLDSRQRDLAAVGVTLADVVHGGNLPKLHQRDDYCRVNLQSWQQLEKHLQRSNPNFRLYLGTVPGSSALNSPHRILEYIK